MDLNNMLDLDGPGGMGRMNPGMNQPNNIGARPGNVGDLGDLNLGSLGGPGLGGIGGNVPRAGNVQAPKPAGEADPKEKLEVPSKQKIMNLSPGMRKELADLKVIDE